MRNIVLASASPRRKEILKSAGYDFVVRPVDVDESIASSNPGELVMELAKIKAIACLNSLSDNEADSVVVGADTLVFVDDVQLGKPHSVEDWKASLRTISGRSHEVLTGVCVCYDGNVKTFYSATKVHVAKLSEEDIDECIARGEDMDKAGGYAIQGAFSKYITAIEGEYNNVVGFPIAMFREMTQSIMGGNKDV